jgi:hypothetical protein
MSKAGPLVEISGLGLRHEEKRCGPPLNFKNRVALVQSG